MGKDKLIFCEICNPKRFFQEDRRKLVPENQVGQSPPSQKSEQRSKPHRRKVHDRRIRGKMLSGIGERRSSVGRRPFDGHTWFEGVVDDAIRDGWEFWDAKGEVICPKCQKTVA